MTGSATHLGGSPGPVLALSLQDNTGEPSNEAI